MLVTLLKVVRLNLKEKKSVMPLKIISVEKLPEMNILRNIISFTIRLMNLLILKVRKGEGRYGCCSNKINGICI